MPVVMLYGPPAAGKNTATEALVRLDDSYQIYERLKVGAGRTAGYRMTTLSHVDALRSAGSLVWETRRYDALYVVDRTSLTDMLEVCIPVVHLGQAEAVKAVIPSDAVRHRMAVVPPRCRARTDSRTQHRRHDSTAAGMGRDRTPTRS
jgi:guanylate kinase